MRTHRTFKHRVSGLSAGLGIALLASHPVMADDGEIFTANTSSVSPNSNVVFILDTSGSMDKKPKDKSSTKKKIDIVKDVFKQIIFDTTNAQNPGAVNPANQGLNFALMRFNSNQGNSDNGGRFITELQPLNDQTKTTIWNAVNNLTAKGRTPLAETAYEASRYFDNLAPLYGKGSVAGVQKDIVTDNSGVITSSTYDSPFNAVNSQTQCAINNHIVLLTDGLPTSDGAADSAINALPNTSTCSDSTGPNCLPQVAKYLFSKDYLGDIPGTQNVKTHTIAFDLNDAGAVNLLKTTAANGGGQFFPASNAAELSDSINKIVYEVNRSAKSFVAPAVSVSSANQFAHDNTLYFALFQPAVSPQWGGNMKGYRVSADGVLKDFSEPPIVAQDSSGDFVDDARSKWSSVADGNNILQGGAAGKFTLSQTRSIYTQNASNAIVELASNTVSNSDLGAADNSEKTAIINWARGKTDDGLSLRDNIIGDPLHSQPVVLDYRGSVGPVIFFGTNQGYLHAVDADSGVEKFAFIPRALLGNLKTYKENIIPPNGQSRPYGIDGPISIIVKDRNDNHVVDTASDQVILIAGMRRGGGNYYALDVTDLNNPQLLWQVNGGSGDFQALAQTWSKPVLTKMPRFNSSSGEMEPRDVVLFSGGYDTAYDPNSSDAAPLPQTPTGNAIYAVDLYTGSLVWKATGTTGSGDATESSLTVPGMNNAIPADVSAIDTDSDGVMDRLYVIDIVGKIFRVDFVNNDASTDAAKYVPIGRLFADLSGDNRRFFNAIDVSYSKIGLQPMIHLSVGSGLRPHPLYAASSDRMYSVRDRYVYGNLPAAADFTVLTQSDLTSTTSGANASITNGWYFDLGTGEKALSKSTTLGGYVFFTTYFPPAASNTPSCTAKLGTGALYAVKLSDSAPMIANSRHIPLNSVGIPPSPLFLTLEQPTPANPDPENPFINTDTKTYLMVGTEIINDDGGNNNSQTLSDFLQSLYPILNNPTAKFYWQQQY